MNDLSGNNYTETPQVDLEFLMNGPEDGPNFSNPPPILEHQKEEKDQCVVVLLIYQYFSMSPIQFKLIPRMARFIFPLLKNGLYLEFSALCGYQNKLV
jgi:hypothetical protein